MGAGLGACQRLAKQKQKAAVPAASARQMIAMKTQIKVSETRFPKLTRAVLRRASRESLGDVVRNGASSGVTGFIYYAETLAFYKAHKAEILALAEQLAQDLGEDMVTMISSFSCLRNDKLSATQVAEALYSGRGDESRNVRNAMTWFTLEEVSRELNPEL